MAEVDWLKVEILTEKDVDMTGVDFKQLDACQANKLYDVLQQVEEYPHFPRKWDF